MVRLGGIGRVYKESVDVEVREILVYFDGESKIGKCWAIIVDVK